MTTTGPRPFITYFGAKWRMAPSYPPPQHRRLVEAFAGSAGYALRYWQNDVELYDVNPQIIGVWDYLIKAKEREIRFLPVGGFHSLDELPDVISQEARWLMGFWIQKAATAPGKTITAWNALRPKSSWGPEVRERIASQLRYIRHWKATLASYETIANGEACWFVDPPYAKEGVHYRHHTIDYPHLAEWCKSREGQVIACEQQGADWLPFKPMGIHKSARNQYTGEAIWIR